MKWKSKPLTAAVGVMAITAIAGSAHAVPTVSLGGTDAGDDGLTSAVVGADVRDFNDGSLPAGYSGDGGVVSGSDPGRYAAPLGDSTKYLTIAENKQAGSQTLDFDSTNNYFGLYWGSIDSYNSIEFLDDGTSVGSFSGSDIVEIADGDQTSEDTNQYVNFWFDSDGYDQVVMSTTQYAFESDNHATATVPEPSGLALLAAGMLGLGLRRKHRN